MVLSKSESGIRKRDVAFLGGAIENILTETSKRDAQHLLTGLREDEIVSLLSMFINSIPAMKFPSSMLDRETGTFNNKEMEYACGYAIEGISIVAYGIVLSLRCILLFRYD